MRPIGKTPELKKSGKKYRINMISAVTKQGRASIHGQHRNNLRQPTCGMKRLPTLMSKNDFSLEVR